MSPQPVPDFTTEADPKDAASGKYFQVNVPDFTKESRPNATKRDAYLRIGSMATFADGARGQHLWDQFTGFAADNGIDGHERDNVGEGIAREVRYDPQGRLLGVDLLPSDNQRTIRREVLLAEAGWRDHCDGNRVTTTSGDKVEIIGGNYQLVVLGRALDASGCSRDDHSGGNHIDGTVSPPQTVTKISFTPKYVGGSWSMVEESRKASVHEVFTGQFREDFRGPKRLSITGKVPLSMQPTLVALGEAEIPNTDDDLLSPSDVNPDITELTFAQSITEYTGSLESPVATITSKTYAGALDESVTVTGALSETVSAGSFTETLTSTTAYQTEKVGARYDRAHIGSRMTLETVGDDLTLKTIGYDSTVQVGKHSEVFTPLHTEVTLGRRAEIVIGSEAEYNLGDKTQVAASHSSVAASHSSVAVKSTNVSGVTNNPAFCVFLG